MKQVKRYYVALAVKDMSGTRDIEFMSGPYISLNDAQKFKNTIADKCGLNFFDYEWSAHINIYRASIVEYYNSYVIIKQTKTKVVYKKSRRGKNLIIKVPTNYSVYSEDEFIGHLTDYM